jgi:SAM-dependent methyltransferase
MNLLRRFWFNLWYFRNPPWDTGITPPELHEFIATHPAGRAIDIGCGTGTNVITLAKAGWQVTGFDFAARAIQLARRKVRRAKVQANLFTDDATRMKNVSGQFDLVLDIGCFHTLENKADYLNQLDRILAPHGFWLMYGFLASTPPGLADSDLGMVSAHALTLLSRSNGFDRGEHPSAWFLYQKSGK